MSANQNYQSVLDAMFDARFAPAKIRAAMQKGLDQGVSYTQSIAKVDTGYLKSKIKGKMVDDYTAMLESAAEYSGYVNDGTWKMSGDQFFDKGTVTTGKSINENLSKL